MVYIIPELNSIINAWIIFDIIYSVSYLLLLVPFFIIFLKFQHFLHVFQKKKKEFSIVALPYSYSTNNLLQPRIPTIDCCNVPRLLDCR